MAQPNADAETDPISMLSRFGKEWTWQDLDGLPEAAFYEIVDGALVVSPRPSTHHQVAAAQLIQMLGTAAPSHLLVLAPGIDLGRTMRIPDVLVMKRSGVIDNPGIAAPEDILLAVEVLSPSSPTTDRITKRAEYLAAGIPQYWLVDHREVSLTVLRGPEYADVTTYRGDEVFDTDQPFPIRLAPAQLLP